MKLDRGTIVKWQIHKLNLTKKQLKDYYPEVKIAPAVFTGTVEEDPTGRYSSGYHMRSSLIVSIKRKGDIQIVETLNSIYKLKGLPGDIFPDLGNDALNIFY